MASEQHPRDSGRIGTHVLGIRTREYLGVIVGGSICTGMWTVEAPDGSRCEYPGPDMQAAEPEERP